MRRLSDGIIHRMTRMILDKEYDWAIQNRYFWGDVVEVNHLGTVKVRKLGEQIADGADYICCVPGYVPSIDDRVMLCNSNDTYGHVVFPLAPSSVPVPVVLENGAGPGPVNVSFSFFRAGLALVEYSTTCWASTNTTLQMIYSIDGTNSNHWAVLAGTISTGVRMTMPTVMDVFGSTGSGANSPGSGTLLAAGKHTFTLTAGSGTNFDANDRFFLKISRLEPNANYA